MKFYKETTKWDSKTPNHTYLLSDDKSKVYGYIKAKSGGTFTFKNPLPFNTRYRTFVVVKELGDIALEEPGQSWKVDGSKGESYVVKLVDGEYSCTCSGFKFRGECKHVKQIQEKL